MHRISLLACVLLGTGLMAGCSGDDDDDNDSMPPAPPPMMGGPIAPTGTTPGTLQSQPVLTATVSSSDLLGTLGVGGIGQQAFAALVGTPPCRVDVFNIQYNTLGGANEATTASGALMLPNGTDAACQGGKPLLLYAHGTATERSFNIGAVNNADNIEGILMAALFAANGYIVVAPNYAGYDTSTLGYHPFLNADQQSKEMIDALAAARSALPTASASVTDGGKLFITGYSQGGFVAMATHRALQAAGTPVTASAPLSGPYALSAFGDAVFQGQVNLGQPQLLVLATSSYLRSNNLYMNPTEIFEPQFAAGIEMQLPSTAMTMANLPGALFSSTPPDPAFAAFTPATMPASLASIFASGFGEPHLVTNAYRLAFLNDAQLNPDGGFPTLTNNMPPASPMNPLRAAFKANDLRNWAPTSPMLLCGGNQDPTVFYMNTQLIQSFFSTTSPTAPVTVLDVDSPEVANDPFSNTKQAFSAAKNIIAGAAVVGGASDGGASAVLDQYHAGLVPPFCISAARGFFADK